MREGKLHQSSRRGFLRNVAAAVVLAPALPGKASETQTVPARTSQDVSLLSRITLGKDLYEHDDIVHGTLSFRRKPAAPIRVQWIDSFGRVAGEQRLPPVSSLAKSFSFAFDLRAGLTYANTICILVGDARQAVSAHFLRSPAPAEWNDYQIITWAYYPDGYYDQLRSVGVNGTIAYRDGDFSPVLDNNFNFYVEQMLWEVYANYHKDLAQWRDVISKVRTDRANLDHWVRQPCLNDPKTQAYIRERTEKYVRQHSAFRPLYYSISDELGQGDQISANDFCHSTHCTIAFAEYLRKSYGSIQDLRKEWGLGEVIRWDDESIRSGADWEKANLMISRTTTDAAFEAISLANLQQRYGNVAKFNREWGTSFPEPHGEMSPRETWEPVLGAARDTLSVLTLSEAELEKALGPLEQFNIRCGNRAGWAAPQRPTSFKSWTAVKEFLTRYDKELGEVSSTRGWNAAAWSDFRNFMDSTFADAVQRSAMICKAEDPHARCATEGGQAPFAFGWYNYEQVLRVVDVIEPYNIGNNVEIVRSLKPETIMLSTVGFDHKPGTPMTAEDRLRQRQALRPVWWELFHSHQGTLIWDDQEEPATFVNLETGELQVPAETFKNVFLEIRNGIGMLAMNCDRTQDGIAIHYSHPSIQAHWLLENAKKAREWMMNTVEAYVTSRFVAVRNSWTKLIEDLQLQYDFVSATQVATGALTSGKYRVFILPESVALSAEEAEQIRAFVNNGGTVVVDFRCGQLNERCRDTGKGALDDLFGIGSGAPKTVGLVSKLMDEEGPEMSSVHLESLEPADPALTSTIGKPRLRNGEIPMWVVNRIGKGRAVYLNLDVSGYAFDRLNPKAPGTLPALLEGIMSAAEIKPRVRVLGADGKRLPGTEVVIFKNGVCEQVVIFRNPQLDDGGWGSYRTKKSNWRDWTTDADNSALEKEEPVTIEWNGSLPTYDVRGKKDLGSISTLKTTLSPWEPLVFTRSPQPLAALKVSLPSNLKAGSALLVNLMADSHPEETRRFVHVDVVDPSGEVYSLYSRNEIVARLPHTIEVPTAYSDPIGRWSVKVRDVISGQTIGESFDLTA